LSEALAGALAGAAYAPHTSRKAAIKAEKIFIDKFFLSKES
jgi:hypothetical protein